MDENRLRKENVFIIARKNARPGHFRFSKRQISDESTLVVSEHEMETLPNAVGNESPKKPVNITLCDTIDKNGDDNVECFKTDVYQLCDEVFDVVHPKKEDIIFDQLIVQQVLNEINNKNTLLSIPGVPLPANHRHGSASRLSFSSNISFLTPSTGSCKDIDPLSDESSRISFIVRERLHSLAGDIFRRTTQIKEHIQKPPTPDCESLHSQIDNNDKSEIDKRSLKSFVTEYAVSPLSHNSALDVSQLTDLPKWKKELFKRCHYKNCLPSSIDPQRNKYLIWLAFLSLCFLYNAFAIPLRATYPYQTADNLFNWLIVDYFCDAVYLIDMFVVKPRIRFMRGGLPVKTKKDLHRRYYHSAQFKHDLLSLLPLDIFYLIPTVGTNSLLRMPRMLKINCFWNLFYLLDSRVKNPYGLRVSKSIGYLIYVIHVNSCVFYSISAWEGLGSTPFTYDGKGNAYLRCFYFATKIATCIGNTEDPTNVVENLYMLIAWMMGVFIVAMLLGQIRDIVATANRNREEFRKTMDDALQYCQTLKLPPDVQNKVREWFIYTWREQKTLDESALLQKLPIKLQTDLAISVHFQTLSKVQLFKDCDKALLRDLVLKLKPVLFLPGDYVCKKGEVGKEMYIVSKGILEVIGGPNGTTVFATLKEGSVFGEVSLLALSGGNRRTADVKSRGFSNLFVLSKDDLNEAIKDYPDAQRILKRKARELIKKHEGEDKGEKVDIQKIATVTSHMKTPKMLATVATVINPDTKSGQLLHAMLQKDQHKRSIHNKPEYAVDDESDLESDTSSILSEILNGLSVQDILEGRFPNASEYHERTDEIIVVADPCKNDN